MSTVDDPVVDEPAGAPEPPAPEGRQGSSRDEVHLARAIRKGKVAPPDWKGDDWDDPDDVLAFGTGVVRPDRRLIGRIFAVVAVLVVVGLLIGGGIGLWALRQVNPPGAPGAAVAFNVTDDDTLEAVSHRLESAGIVTDAGVFEWYVKRKGGIELAAGDYSLKPKDTMGNIVSALRTPPAQTFLKVTFPEGFTVKQMSERIAKDDQPHLRRRVHQGGEQRLGEVEVHTEGLTEPRRRALPRHLPGRRQRDGHQGRPADVRPDGARRWPGGPGQRSGQGRRHAVRGADRRLDHRA